jgi:hypothetical protein
VTLGRRPHYYAQKFSRLAQISAGPNSRKWDLLGSIFVKFEIRISKSETILNLEILKSKTQVRKLICSEMSLQAQKEGFTKLGSAGDYANLIEGGLAASNEKIKQNPEKIFRFIRAALKGINFFVSKKEPALKYMMDAVRMTDRELANSIYDIQSKLILREGSTEDEVLQSMIDAMKKTTKVQRDIKVSDVFNLSFVKKAGEELKTTGWKP